jgi:hypothetical protein
VDDFAETMSRDAPQRLKFEGTESRREGRVQAPDPGSVTTPSRSTLVSAFDT